MTVLFPPGIGGGEGVGYGYKGKGILIHRITDANGMPVVAITTPANDDERQQVFPMLAQIRVATGKFGNPTDHKSKNGSGVVKNFRADRLGKSDLVTNKSVLSRGFNASIEDSLFDGNV